MTPSEEWRPAAGFPDYEVSSHGRVRGIDRRVPWRGTLRLIEGRVLKTRLKDGYVHVGLRVNHSATSNIRIHRLVAATFIGPCPEGMEVLHINGVRDDNRIENLRYGTRQENVMDTIRHGRHPWAGRSHCRNGHEYTPENTWARFDGPRPKRRCRTCAHAADKRSRMRRRAA